MIVLSVLLDEQRALVGRDAREEELVNKETLTDKQGELLGAGSRSVIAEEDGYSAESDAAELLSVSVFRRASTKSKCASCPAAWKMRVLLAQALFGNPDAAAR